MYTYTYPCIICYIDEFPIHFPLTSSLQELWAVAWDAAEVSKQGGASAWDLR